MPQRLHVNLAQTSHEELIRIATKSGFMIFMGAKHDKIKTKDGKFVTMIPRHRDLLKPTAKGIVKAMNVHGASIDYR